MRVKELKAELASLRIDTRDAFEKEELVKRLYEARRNRAASATDARRNSPTSSRTAGRSDGSVIEAPLTFVSLENFKSVAASNADVYVRPSPGQFAAVAFDTPSGGPLTLLVDTACSGVVLRPSAARSRRMQTFNAPGSMTAAGGMAASTAFARLDGLELCGERFGALNAAVQDIGALPSALDGIVGLSFLNQFPCVDFDFREGRLILHRRNLSPPPPAGLLPAAEISMRLTMLGIHMADVTLDNRGPVKMLVDTGAAATLLNWRGVADMGLSSDSPQVTRNSQDFGAIGADNMALRLTHRYVLGRSFNLSSKAEDQMTGVVLGGNKINIDIGDIPVLDILQNEGVGGILGADLLMQCDVVRLNLQGSGKIILFK